MGKQSTRENKTIYQLCREAAGLTRAEASEKMDAVSDSKIEKFEYETQEPTPYDILQMADAYKRPDLCNYYCSHKCEIGHRYVPEVEMTDLIVYLVCGCFIFGADKFHLVLIAFQHLLQITWDHGIRECRTYERVHSKCPFYTINILDLVKHFCFFF